MFSFVFNFVVHVYIYPLDRRIDRQTDRRKVGQTDGYQDTHAAKQAHTYTARHVRFQQALAESIRGSQRNDYGSDNIATTLKTINNSSRHRLAA